MLMLSSSKHEDWGPDTGFRATVHEGGYPYKVGFGWPLTSAADVC